MDFLSSMEISASGLSAQRTRINIISQNLANAETTRTAEGGPYRRRVTVFSAKPFESHLTQALDAPPQQNDPRKGVLVNEIAQDNSPFKKVFDPNHPDADADGYVLYPNVDVVSEMVNLVSATRSYEANVTAVSASKNMALKALEIVR